MVSLFAMGSIFVINEPPLQSCKDFAANLVQPAHRFLRAPVFTDRSTDQCDHSSTPDGRINQ